MFGPVAIVACAHAGEPDGAAQESPMHAAIKVVSAATGADFRATVTLTNDGAEPLAINTLFFAIPSVSLEVRTKAGDEVPGGPPPVPPLDDGKAIRTLAAGDSMKFEYRGAALFSTSPPPGDYEVRFAGWSPAFAGFTGVQGAIVSPWAAFHVDR